MKEHPGCFQVLAIMDHVLINICAGFCVDVTFYLISVYIKEEDCWIICKNMFSFVRNCLPEWLYHFAFPPAMNESSCCSTFLSTFGIVSVLNFCVLIRCIVVYLLILICISMMTYDVEHFFMHLFALDNFLSFLFFFCPGLFSHLVVFFLSSFLPFSFRSFLSFFLLMPAFFSNFY